MGVEPHIRRKIEETVRDVLKQSNLEEATEFKVRVSASERLGIDLSDPECKQIVTNVAESYLLNVPAEDGKEKPPEPSAPEEPREAVQETKPTKEDSNRIICRLSSRRNVIVQDFRGKKWVTIREFYHKDGKQLPGAKGINLSTEQWSALKNSMATIEEAIIKIEGKTRSELHGKQNEDVSNSVLDVAPLELVPIEICRFVGKNYHLWVQQMELLLKQLKVEYMLAEPCPNASLKQDASAEVISEAKAAERRWLNDDLMCHHNILGPLI